MIMDLYVFQVNGTDICLDRRQARALRDSLDDYLSKPAGIIDSVLCPRCNTYVVSDDHPCMELPPHAE